MNKEVRKQKEAEFHDRVRDKKAEEETRDVNNFFISNRIVYDITRKSQ